MDIYEYHEPLRKVKTESGWVEGINGNNPIYTVFKGIPYAKSPVAELRWKAPQPVEPWEGVRQCYKYSAIPYQFRGKHGRIPKTDMYQKEFYRYQEPMSEDCLYLNIWTPAVDRNENLPVMLWIHGGANICGSGTEPQVDGEELNKRGVILVSFNYRVGILGFMAHPELSEESDEKVSGNYGILDQIAALNWVRNNIREFGGNPDNITIFGQSSGAANCYILSCSPLTKGKITGAIMESAPSLGDVNVHRSPSEDYQTLKEAEELGTQLMKKAKCNSIQEMRKMDYESLLQLSCVDQADIKVGQFIIFPVVLDHYVLHDTPAHIIFRGENHDINYMAGSTTDEFVAWDKLDRSEVKKFAEKFSDPSAFEKFCEGLTDEEFAHGLEDTGELKNVIMAENRIKHGKKPAYLYYFTHNLPGENGGTFHTCEMWFHFSTLNRCWRPFTGTDFDLSVDMADYWANFATSGNPNEGNGNVSVHRPEWKPYTVEDRMYMEMGDQRKMIHKPFRKMQQYFLDEIVYKGPLD